MVIVSKNPSITIVNVGYRSTNFWVVGAGTSRLLVDLGWPGTMGTMRANLDRLGVPFKEIRYGLATHYHIDHAGLAQNFKQAGVPLLVLETLIRAAFWPHRYNPRLWFPLPESRSVVTACSRGFFRAAA